MAPVVQFWLRHRFVSEASREESINHVQAIQLFLCSLNLMTHQPSSSHIIRVISNNLHRAISAQRPPLFRGHCLAIAMAPRRVFRVLWALFFVLSALNAGQLFSMPASGAIRSPNSPVPRNAMKTLDRAPWLRKNHKFVRCVCHNMFKSSMLFVVIPKKLDPGWWFGACFIFQYIGNTHPN